MRFANPPSVRTESLAGGLLSPSAYEAWRRAGRSRLIAYRHARTLALGPCMRLQFEDALTVRYQVQEVLRAERIADAEEVQRELDTYAHLLPDGQGWKATLLIELPDAAERALALPRLSRAAHCIHVEVAGLRATALANEDLADGRNARHLERPSGVHFLHFALPMALRAALQSGAAAALGSDDDNDGSGAAWRLPIPHPLLAQLCAELEPVAGGMPAAASAPRSVLARTLEGSPA